ncbi:hypothetical protein POM88_037613 [Heracleum sosnowskyi]|uniref:Uncharacterized protein n=1 Tax=Heracleum sosnowskyi TaxID=360622 RepID=A0AAD8MFH3_9APIA|nr:hypothetical protein POM88_037613 [Heracleum sosnowskyi]
MESLDQVPRTQLNEVLEKLATTAFPDRADPIQQSSWDQYMRIAGEVIDQVMHNCKKAIVEDNQTEMDRLEQDRLLLEMDFGRENDDTLKRWGATGYSNTRTLLKNNTETGHYIL